MALSSDDALKHTAKATTEQLQYLWAIELYQALSRHLPEPEAIKLANRHVERMHGIMERIERHQTEEDAKKRAGGSSAP